MMAGVLTIIGLLVLAACTFPWSLAAAPIAYGVWKTS
jgi:hypothetical protein